MKFLGILAAAMLVLGPAIASADPASTASTDERPAPGPVASTSHEDDDDDDLGLIVLFPLGVGLLVLPLLFLDGSDSTSSTTAQ